MAKRNSFASRQREREKAIMAQRRQAEKEFKELERAQREYVRAQEQEKKAQEKASKEAEKDRQRLYIERREAQVKVQNAEIEERIAQLQILLKSTLSVDDFIDLRSMKVKLELPRFALPFELTHDQNRPQLERYLPQKPSGLQALLPGAKQKYAEEVAAAHEYYERDLKKYQTARELAITERKRQHDERVAMMLAEAESKDTELEQFALDLEGGEPEAIINYCSMVLVASVYPEGFPQHAKIAYVPESKQLVIDYDLPTIDVIPEIASYKYARTKDEITSTSRPIAQRKALYSSIIAQITLRTLHELFEADRLGHLETIVFNGFVTAVDKGTGRDVNICLITVRTTRDLFTQINLDRVEPDLCLKTLNASVSKSPTEMTPVRPVVEFNMVDRRFVQEADVLSTLDHRTNLMDLTPGEFESLITNLFQKMGLEAKQTQASRDGGVDCVAFDPRPIFGGKVVIQAKRYKHTVGVSAVRDLFGTVHNEGASKGILVTTSGYSKSVFEFADGKPIELISGSNLLYLLAEYAGVEAKIEMPDDWKDPDSDAS
jgi:restriction system protein